MADKDGLNVTYSQLPRGHEVFRVPPSRSRLGKYTFARGVDYLYDYGIFSPLEKMSVSVSLPSPRKGLVKFLYDLFFVELSVVRIKGFRHGSWVEYPHEGKPQVGAESYHVPVDSLTNFLEELEAERALCAKLQAKDFDNRYAKKRLKSLGLELSYFPLDTGECSAIAPQDFEGKMPCNSVEHQASPEGVWMLLSDKPPEEIAVGGEGLITRTAVFMTSNQVRLKVGPFGSENELVDWVEQRLEAELEKEAGHAE